MLIPPDEGPPIAGLEVPNDLYWIVRSPAPLAGMRLPRSPWPWHAIHSNGFSDLVLLHPDDYSSAPLEIVFAEHLEDLAHGGPPHYPDRELHLVRMAVRASLRSLQAGRGVIVHCWGGRGRTGTVLGCVLRELGYEAEAVIDYLRRIHVARGKSGWPESLWQADLVRGWKTDG